jgi:predicted SnoaL-like aldol condensation-catalyzing enzyme
MPRDLEQEQRNRVMVIDWYLRLFNDKDMSTTEGVLDEHYIQHNPTVASGRAATMAALPGLWAKYPDMKYQVLRSAAEKDLVFLHIYKVLFPGDRGRINADIYRLVDNKIVEHWDVIQEIPEVSFNDNTML